MIRKRMGLILPAVAVALLLLLVSQSAFADTVRWRMATGRTPALTPYHDADVNLVNTINAMSGGRLQVTIHPAGELLPPFEVFDAVRTGTIHAGAAWSTYWTSKNTAFDLFCSMGFMMHPADWISWLYEGGGLELGQELYAKYNIKFFPMAVTGPESGFRTNKPIRTLADFKGVNLRSGVLQNIWVLQQVGANPVRIPGGEIYMALRLGTIDGAEFGVPSTDWNMKLNEVTKYQVTPAGWHQVGTVSDFMINMDAWNKLPADIQAIVENAAKANLIYSYAKANWDAIGAMERFKEAGIEESRLDDEAVAKLEALSIEFIEMESKRNPDYAKIAKSMVEYLKRSDVLREAEGRFASGSNLRRYPEIE
jgi:TRAP-type mannitol/chloroaromatic compound transport system substrate-binding protein